MRTSAQIGVVAIVGAAGLAGTGVASAAPVEIRVTVESLVSANDVSFAPLRLGFHNGTFDSFNINEAASPAIVSIAEGGSGSAWFPAFAAAEPNATLGTVGGGPLVPGATASATFVVDPTVNRFFTFGSMVVPSNDHFIGNDNPQGYRLFDATGQLQVAAISQFGRDIWDAGSEVTDPMNAAFLAIGNNALRTPENGVVNNDIDELNAYNGLQTAAGYTFQRQFGAADEVYRITFEVVPAPAAGGLLGVAALFAGRRRRR
jgi:hypothetical protein